MVVGCSGVWPRGATISGLTETALAVKSVEPVPRRPETCHVSWKVEIRPGDEWHEDRGRVVRHHGLTRSAQRGKGNDIGGVIAPTGKPPVP